MGPGLDLFILLVYDSILVPTFKLGIIVVFSLDPFSGLGRFQLHLASFMIWDPIFRSFYFTDAHDLILVLIF
jgi:hypothetical protein